VLNKNGADATRQWAAAGGATGSDIPYRAQDVEYGRRFLVKLWNASSFTANLLADYKPIEAKNVKLELLDKWIISKAENITKKVTEEYEKCQFNVAIEDIRNFFWHVFCDYYLEAIKDRLYSPAMHGSAKRLAAQYTLHEVLYRMLQLLAPVTPHVTEEIYQFMFKGDKGFESLQISPWPKFNQALVDEETEKEGDVIIGAISLGRQCKAENKLPLNLPLTGMIIHTGSAANVKVLTEGRADIAGTLKVVDFNKVKIESDSPLMMGQINPADIRVRILFDKDYARK
jgi:valyl-tRNA synthetase